MSIVGTGHVTATSTSEMKSYNKNHLLHQFNLFEINGFGGVNCFYS